MQHASNLRMQGRRRVCAAASQQSQPGRFPNACCCRRAGRSAGGDGSDGNDSDKKVLELKSAVASILARDPDEKSMTEQMLRQMGMQVGSERASEWVDERVGE